MKRTTLLQDYYELKESGSSSDFPNILGTQMYRRLVQWVQSVPDEWRRYAPTQSLSDFRPQNMVVGYEAEDLLTVGEDGIYQDSQLADAAWSITLGTYGRAFSINRHVVINDDLGYIKDQPRRFGRAAARSIARFAVSLLEGSGTTFDGVALFHTTHSNFDDGGDSVLSRDAIKKGITAMANQSVLGVYHTVRPKLLVAPPALEFTAKEILATATIMAAGGDATVGVGAVILPTQNVLQNIVTPVIDPFLTSSTAWYLLADPNDAPVIELAFLNGKQTPDLLVEKPTMQNLAGGDDQWEFEFDIMKYKVRYDYGGAVSRWWGGFKFAGA